MQAMIDQVKPYLSAPTKRRLLATRLALRMPTFALRMLPDFLVVGGQRCGTSSLYKYLGMHPRILPSLRKETEYFSRRYSRGIGWYRAHFPLRRPWDVNGDGRRYLTFEATPDYLLHPLAAGRAAELVPEAKIIVLLRDPVARAHSHYRHMVRLGLETLSFEEAIDREHQRLSDDLARLDADPLHPAVDFLRYSYLLRGQYGEHLERWLARYTRSRILVLRSEDLFEATSETYLQILEFLGVESWQPREFRNFSSGRDSRTTSGDLPAASRTRLEEHFAPWNRRLGELLGWEPGW